ncbi:MAG: beta-N-acetylhexosaminidase family protein [Pirellulaceae bacterium]
MTRLLRIGLVLLGCVSPLHAQPTNSVQLVLPAQANAVVQNIGRVFARQIRQRCAAEIVTSGTAPLVVELALDTGIGAEGFRIEDRVGGGVRISGNDERGLLYGVGKFLRTSRFGEGGFTPGLWRGTSIPQKPVRGIYLATHFHNFYHDAPVEQVQQYVEDLGLWGFNTVVVWYDMHHFSGFDSAAATEFRSRLQAICSAARQIGLEVGLTRVANEGYANSPAAIRADVRGMRGSIFATDICPSQPEGREYILQEFGRLCDWASAFEPKWVILWPYDSGGCGCAACQPWGSNGFVKMSESLAALARQELPQVQIIVSTWFCDEGEWQGLAENFTARHPWADYLLAEGTTRPTPGGLPLVGFPEISMHETFPWGGFGATPLPRRAQDQWNVVKQFSQGGFPYSEGLYEDITKAVLSQLYWNDRPIADTLREYADFEFAPEVSEEVVQVITTLEQNHHWRWWPGELEGVKLDLDWFPSRGAAPQADPGAEAAYESVRRIDAQLSPQARQSWRWRLLFVRALLDAELKINGGRPNPRCDEAFAELIEIYHAQNANPALRPPLAK